MYILHKYLVTIWAIIRVLFHIDNGRVFVYTNIRAKGSDKAGITVESLSEGLKDVKRTGSLAKI